LVDKVLGNPDADLARAKETLRGWAVHQDGSPYELNEYPSRRALFQGETVRAEPMVYRRGDGRLIDLEMHAGPVYGETGEIIAAVAVAMDVTERRLAEARQAFYSICKIPYARSPTPERSKADKTNLKLEPAQASERHVFKSLGAICNRWTGYKRRADHENGTQHKYQTIDCSYELWANRLSSDQAFDYRK